MKLAVALAVLPAAAAFVGPAAPAAEVRMQESKSDLEALAKGLNPTIGFWDPLNVAGASGSLYGFNNEQTIAWYRQAEIKHGRVAMAAFVGYCVQANGGHWATKMTLGGADWPSGEHLCEIKIRAPTPSTRCWPRSWLTHWLISAQAPRRSSGTRSRPRASGKLSSSSACSSSSTSPSRRTT